LGWMTVAGLLVVAGTLRVLAIRDISSVSDSETFTTTLRDFTPCIEAACETPRAVKWLINRVRLYAMLLRHWSLGKNGALNTRYRTNRKGIQTNMRYMVPQKEQDHCCPR
jgi:hypothetical protein